MLPVGLRIDTFKGERMSTQPKCNRRTTAAGAAELLAEHLDALDLVVDHVLRAELVWDRDPLGDTVEVHIQLSAAGWDHLVARAGPEHIAEWRDGSAALLRSMRRPCTVLCRRMSYNGATYEHIRVTP